MENVMSPPGDTRFIFVGGVARSGTSLVQKILDLHPEIYGGPELGLFQGLMATYRRLLADVRSGKLSMLLDAEHVRASYRDFVLSLYRPRLESDQARFVSEKTPSNLHAFDALADVFPEARFVWVVRDPRDVLCSLRGVQARSRELGVAVDAGRWLDRDLADMRQSLLAGEAFRRSHGTRLRIVHYEDLLAAPRQVAERLCTFLGVEFEEQMLATGRSNDVSRAISSPRKTRGVFYTKEMYDRPIDQSNVGKWRTQLDMVSIQAVHARLGSMDLPCLQKYDLPAAAAPWRLLFSVWRPTAKMTRKLTRMLKA